MERDVRGSRVVSRRDHLHRRDLQERGEDDVRQGRVAGRPFGPVQLKPGRQHQARHRLREGEEIDEEALEALVRAAVALNTSRRAWPRPERLAVQSRLRLTRQQILAFRRRVGGLDARHAEGPESLRRAAWAGLQDSMPRAALLSLHARVDGVEPSTWEDPSLAQLWGPRYSTYVVAEARLRAVLAGEASRQRQGPPAGRADGRAAARPSRRQAHDGPRGRARARHRQLDQVRRDDGHGRDPLGRRASADHLDGRRCRRSTRPTRAASSLGATSTSSGRRRLTGSPAGPGSRGARRPTRSPRSKDRCCRSDRRSATSGCSPTTSRRCAPPRRPRRARAPAAERRCLLPARRSRAGAPRPAADQRQRLWTSRVWPGALLVDGEIRGTWRRAHHTVRIDAWARLSRGGATRSRPRPAPCRFRGSTGRSRWSGKPERVRSGHGSRARTRAAGRRAAPHRGTAGQARRRGSRSGRRRRYRR